MFSKQDEIREGLHRIFYINNLGGAGECIAYNDIVLDYLSSQGVVMQVERELPEKGIALEGDEFKDGFDKGQDYYKDVMLDAGYVAAEPLVKE